MVGAIGDDRAFHAPSLKVSMDRIVKEKDYYGQRFRKKERYRSTTDPPASASFAERNDLATQNPSGMTVSKSATPKGVVEFTRMMTIVESRYYHNYPQRISCITRASRRGSLERNGGDSEQRYKAQWAVWTIGGAI